ncbi:MAG: hypothetical protein PHF57_12700 [Methanoregula sp.]|jgi:hypothetical protein|nr:hypothetical protein [Methanoregula sp.]
MTGGDAAYRNEGTQDTFVFGWLQIIVKVFDVKSGMIKSQYI